MFLPSSSSLIGGRCCCCRAKLAKQVAQFSDKPFNGDEEDIPTRALNAKDVDFEPKVNISNVAPQCEMAQQK